MSTASPLSFPELPDGHNHVWIFPLKLTAGESAVFKQLIPEQEWNELNANPSPSEALRRLSTRGCVRRLLSDYLGRAPEDLTFSLDRHGKPYLAGQNEAGLHFNATHTGEWGAAAISRGHPVGIDMEYCDTQRAWQDIMRTYFTEEEWAGIDALPPGERLNGFYTVWTCKEACAKATGRGLMTGQEAPEIVLTPDGPRTETPHQLHTWNPRAGYTAALACPANAQTVLYFNWEDYYSTGRTA